MNAGDVRRLFAYNDWANHRVLVAAAPVSLGDFGRDLGASFGSLRGTLIHIMWGEKRWLQWWLDGTAVDDPPTAAFPDVGSLREAWLVCERNRNTFLSGLTDERLNALMDVRGASYRLADLMQHLLNHSTYHRGQVTLLLRQLGHTPAATDFRIFVNAIGSPAAESK